MSRAFLGVGLVLLAGCNTEPALPKTYPVTGKVVFKGGQAMTGGAIEFKSADDPMLRVVGTIDPNGTFTLSTLKDNSRVTGAPEGDFQVTVLPPLGTNPGGSVADAQKGQQAIRLPKSYRIEAKDNTLDIELPVGPPKS